MSRSRSSSRREFCGKVPAWRRGLGWQARGLKLTLSCPPRSRCRNLARPMNVSALGSSIDRLRGLTMKWHTGLLIALLLTFAVLPAYLRPGELAAQSNGSGSSPAPPLVRLRAANPSRFPGRRPSWTRSFAPTAWLSPTSTRTASPTSSSATSGTKPPTGRCIPCARNARRITMCWDTPRPWAYSPTTSTATAIPTSSSSRIPARRATGTKIPWRTGPSVREDQLWKEHLLATSACNETPIYVDLFKTGKRVLVMGNNGELCYFQPGKDPTQPWECISISGKMAGGAPGSAQYDHGLGCGDVNGDGRNDIITPHGWYEQPEKLDGRPWKFHATKIGPPCADMHVLDVDGDGKADIISSSAHDYGLWWHQQQADGSFLTKDLFPTPPMLAKEPEGYKFNKEEKELFDAVVKFREGQKRSPWRSDAKLCEMARQVADKDTKPTVAAILVTRGDSIEEVMKPLAKRLGQMCLPCRLPTWLLESALLRANTLWSWPTRATSPFPARRTPCTAWTSTAMA